MKTVLLLRHGKSDWSAEVEDRDRPLAKRGREAARAMGEFLARAGLVPDSVVTSPARRAVDTAALAAAAGRWPSAVRTSELLYGADAFGVLAAVRSEPDDIERLMVVGHEPTSSEAVALLVGGGHHRLPTAAVAVIELDVEHWAAIEPACGRLLALVPPRLVARVAT